jgi:DNA-binding Lrp family transcriptional regulator
MTGDANVDELDRKILELIRCRARLSYRAIGKNLGISTGTVSERIRNMEERGIITGFVTVTDPTMLGMNVSMLLCMRISTTTSRDEVVKQLEAFDETSCIHYITGDIDLIVLVRATDQVHAATVLDRVRSIKGVERVDSHVVLSHKNLCSKCGCDCGFTPGRSKDK